MIRSRRQFPRRYGSRVAFVLGIVLLAGCGSASSDDGSSAEPEVPAGATEEAALDLSGVSFEVRRDPG